MKRSFSNMFIITLLCLQIPGACRKSPPTENNEPETILKFKVNGALYEWRNRGFCGIYCGSSFIRWPDRFVLSAINPQNSSNTLSLTIPVTSLSTTTYDVTIPTPISIGDALHKLFIFNVVSGGSTEAGDFLAISITRIHDGKYADGSFSARLTESPYGTSAVKIDITEGSFVNLVIY